MKKKIDLPTALQNRVSGKKVTVVLDTDIAFLMLSTLMRLEDIGADFLMDVPDSDPADQEAEAIKQPADDKIPLVPEKPEKQGENPPPSHDSGDEKCEA